MPSQQALFGSPGTAPAKTISPFAVLTLGGLSSARWPTASFARLAVALASELGLAVRGEESSEEAPLLREIAAVAAAREVENPPVLVCQDPLDVFAALPVRARLLVTNWECPRSTSRSARSSPTPTPGARAAGRSMTT